MKAKTPGCVLRLLRLADERRLQEFFASHTAETVYQRYGYALSVMTHERAFALVNVDQKRNMAAGIFEPTNTDETIHAIARYYTDENNRTAEFAVVVRESMRRRGFADILIHHLALVGQRNGLIAFRAQVLRENYPMRRFCERFHPVFHSIPETDCVEYALPLESILKNRTSSTPGLVYSEN